jgi:hypothetical protein
MARAATSRLKVNPVLGSPPTLEWRPVAELLIDATYQREISAGASQTLIRRIAMFWDWGLCQPLAVSRRPDGVLTIVDGQHRASAAKLRGDIPHLPCVITSYASAGDEAAAFVALNQMRRPLSAIDLFKAAVAAEDKEALLITDALARNGLRLANHTNHTAWKPGDVANIASIQRFYRRAGEGPLRISLAAMARAWPGEVLQYAGSVFPGFAAVALDEVRLRGNPDEVIAGLARLAGMRTQAEWRAAARAAFNEAGGVSLRDGAELVFRRAWRESKGIIETPRSAGPSPLPRKIERLPLSFEEQLALVESGKGKVVDKIDTRPVLPDRTLGGAPPEFI